MATSKQRQAAKRIIGKAIDAAQRHRSIANLPRGARSALGRQAAAVRQRRCTGASAPKTRRELYELARRRGIPGRSRMGRSELARALGQR